MSTVVREVYENKALGVQEHREVINCALGTIELYAHQKDETSQQVVVNALLNGSDYIVKDEIIEASSHEQAIEVLRGKVIGLLQDTISALYVDPEN